MNNVFCFILILFGGLTLTAQNTTLSRQVIGAAGSTSNTASLNVSFTVGEALTPTLNPNNSSVVLTQGFQQTIIDATIGFTLTTTNELCIDRADGTARIDSIVNCPGPYTILWSNGDRGNVARNLTEGDYSVQISSSSGCVQTQNFSIEIENNIECLLRFYSGITPNSDNVNDQWIIDNLELFPDNEVNIFNRAGNRVFQGTNYDNVNVVWGGENLGGGELPPGTYFYIFESGSNVENGWIELIR